MASLNRVHLIGFVGQDPKIGRSHNGNSVASFTIATGERWTDKNTGEVRERTDWHNIVIWNDKLVEIVQKYVKKGSQIYLEGKLQTRKYSANDGSERYITEVLLQGFDGKVVLLDRKPKEEQQEQYQPKAKGNDPISTGRGFANDDLDDDIPF